jgi:hypothetical protein
MEGSLSLPTSQAGSKRKFMSDSDSWWYDGAVNSYTSKGSIQQRTSELAQMAQQYHYSAEELHQILVDDGYFDESSGKAQPIEQQPNQPTNQQQGKSAGDLFLGTLQTYTSSIPLDLKRQGAVEEFTGGLVSANYESLSHGTYDDY